MLAVQQKSMEEVLDALCYPVSNFWGEAISLGQADFTPCFENTAILLVPCVFLFLLAIVQFCAEGHKNKSVNAPPPTAIHVLRTLFSVCLGVIAFVDLMKTIFYDSQNEEIATYQYLSPSILFVTSSLALVCITWFRNRGSRAPGTLLIFWLLMLIYDSLKLRTYILVKMHGAMEPFRNSTGGKNVTYNLILTSVEFAVVLASFILSVIPEKLPYVTTDESLRPCPETKATFLSRITFWWLTNMMFLGYKRPLTDDDLFDLFPEDKADFVVPRFLDAWKKEVCKTERKNAKLIQSLDPSSINADETALNESTESLTSSQENLLPRPQSSPVKLREPSLLKALVKAFGGLMFTAAFFKLVQDLLTFVSPQILKLMINFTADPNIPTWRGYVYAVLLFVNAETQSLFLNQYFHRCFRTGIRVKSAIISAVYRKAMRLNNSARRQSTVGEIVNLMSVDAQRFMDLMPYIHLLWSAPLLMVLAIFFLWQTIGVSVLAGIGVMVLLIPVNAVVAVITRKLQIKQMAYKDQRIKLTNEVLSGVKVIKLYAWEKSFLKSIACVRKKELTVLKWSAYLGAVTSLTWSCAPFMVALATFATYSLTGHNLTSSKAFVALSLFDIFNFPFSFLPMVIASLVQALVSVKRVQKFLKSDELDPDAVVRIPVGRMGEDVDGVKVEGASFRWSKGDRIILKDLNLNVKPKKLVAIVGQVGAGKSSFMSALLGDMEKDCGSIFMKGSIAYAPQQAWVQNASLRDNILFGRPYDGDRYNRALHSCALTPDLEVLPAGDKTEIGEKGINLSGGQKQRVSLARAVYHDSDIYLMDDPLSAVDSHVGKHIFDNVIGPEGVLKDKIRIFATHGVSFLPQCDQIVVMKEGNISEIGTYAELQANDGDFAEFLRNYAQSGFVNDDEDDDDDDKDDDEGALSENDVSESATGEKERKADLPYGVSRQLSRQLTRQMSRQISRQKKEKEAVADAAAAAELTTAEKAETGNVRIGVYADYFRSCTWILVIITLVFFTLQTAASVASSIWLAHWSDVENELAINSSTRVRGVGYYLGIYAGLGFSQGLIVTLSTIAMTVGTILAAMKLHGDLLVNILRSPMSFFDTTPLGRIVNRFSKDIYMIDEVIPQSLGGFLHTFFISVGIVFIISYSTPVFLAVMVPLGVFYFFTQRFYIASSRQLKRIESVTRSPVHSHFQESLTGTSTIRAYGATETFVDESDARVDRNQTAYYPNVCSNRWLAVRLEFVGNCIILFAALFAVIERKSSLTPGLVGLSISYALQITQTMNWIVRMTSALEANIVSVERVKEYSESPTEAPSIVDHFRPRPGWPNRGEVEFKSYSTRYREGLDLVLKRINCHVMPGEKIGIVGRTGAGKSSLTVGIFRIIEAAGGAIVIDGIDISRLGLDDLRSRITIIPQDPVLFSGTLRFNLDPFENHTDDELWRSLENAHLKDFVESADAGLNYEISEGGENLSVGQRQLVCLARALLRKTKILVLDEATAAIDLETDDLIQQTIRREFDDCTVLTIAHRLNTVMDSNRIIVLDKGEKVEFDSPANLLANRGIFHGMAVDAGLAQ